MGLSVGILAVGVVLFYAAAMGRFGQYWGVDITHYVDATRRWVETGSPYLASEVAHRFDFQPLTFLHPPVALWLFLPFTLLPAIAWWAIPLGVVAWSAWSWRPAPWAWPLLALAVSSPRFHGVLIVGNSDLWVWAAVALGLRHGWPALLVAVKPSLAFLALAGIGHRAWWYGIPVAVLVCVPFGALWVDWIRVVLNSPGDLTYSLANLPWLLAPVAAYTARSHRERAATVLERRGDARAGAGVRLAGPS
jgi:hypothetical protein